ncbi:hypothetical protein BKA70DRAFT_1271698 [Coprinopsis sp. MPI-PUGE-AT-0042]|nr:hypothetical protein BKA70DRAFT_1271698 [Coprinopsis sp. MPI-PUGE-AT-0042]
MLVRVSQVVHRLHLVRAGILAEEHKEPCFGPTPAIQSLILALPNHTDSWCDLDELHVYPFPTHLNLLCEAPAPLDARGFLTFRRETTEEAVVMLLREGSLVGLSDQLIDHNERKGKDGWRTEGKDRWGSKGQHWDKRRLHVSPSLQVSRILLVVLLECTFLFACRRCFGSRCSGCSIPFHGLKRALDSPLACSFR